MWRLPKPKFKVLMYGPELPSGGVPGFAHFEPGILVLEGRRYWFTVQFSQVSLDTGGYDGRQWMIAWKSDAGPMKALLQGGDAIDLFIKLAPPELAEQLHLARRARWPGQAGKWLGAAILLILLAFLAASLFWATPLR
jgi:hypothetical protein